MDLHTKHSPLQAYLTESLALAIDALHRGERKTWCIEALRECNSAPPNDAALKNAASLIHLYWMDRNLSFVPLPWPANRPRKGPSPSECQAMTSNCDAACARVDAEIAALKRGDFTVEEAVKLALKRERSQLAYELGLL